MAGATNTLRGVIHVTGCKMQKCNTCDGLTAVTIMAASFPAPPIPLRVRVVACPPLCRALVHDPITQRRRTCPEKAEYWYEVDDGGFVKVRRPQKCFCWRHHTDLQQLLNYQRQLKKAMKATPSDRGMTLHMLELRKFLQMAFFHFVDARDGHHAQIRLLQTQLALCDGSIDDRSEDGDEGEDDGYEEDDGDEDEQDGEALAVVVYAATDAPELVTGGDSKDDATALLSIAYTVETGGEDIVEELTTTSSPFSAAVAEAPAHSSSPSSFAATSHPPVLSSTFTTIPRRSGRPTFHVMPEETMAKTLIPRTDALAIALSEFMAKGFDLLAYALNHTPEDPVPAIPDFDNLVRMAQRQRAIAQKRTISTETMATVAIILNTETMRYVQKMYENAWANAALPSGLETHYQQLIQPTPRTFVIDSSGFSLAQRWRHPTGAYNNPQTNKFRVLHESTSSLRRDLYATSQQPKWLRPSTYADLQCMYEYARQCPEVFDLSKQPWCIIARLVVAETILRHVSNQILDAGYEPLLCNLLLPMHDKPVEPAIAHNMNGWRRYLEGFEQAEDARALLHFVDRFQVWTERPLPTSPNLHNDTRRLLRTRSPLYAWLVCVRDLDFHHPGMAEDVHGTWMRVINVRMDKDVVWFLPTHDFAAESVSLHFEDLLESPCPERLSAEQVDEAERSMMMAIMELSKHVSNLIAFQGPLVNGVCSVPEGERAPSPPPPLACGSPMLNMEKIMSERSAILLRLFMLLESMAAAVLVARFTGRMPSSHRYVMSSLMIDAMSMPLDFMPWQHFYLFLREYYMRMFGGDPVAQRILVSVNTMREWRTPLMERGVSGCAFDTLINDMV
jgi:hypothetical protein